MRTNGNSKIETNRFPITSGNDWEKQAESHGLTKREFFAAFALQGIMANPDMTCLSRKETAKGAVNIADSLIEALNE